MRAQHRLLIVFFALVLALFPATAAMAQAQDGPLLTMWDRGDAVAEWQDTVNTWLEAYPQDIEFLAVDGIYGPLTEGTTRDFQAWADITVDGIVGPETRGAMASALDEAPPLPPDDEPAPDEDGLTADEVLSPGINTEPDLGEAESPMVALTNVNVGTHEGFDRVTFDIGGEGLAGWDVRYVDEATAAGSGQPIDVPGEAILAVNISNVALPGDAPEPTWDGPERIQIGDSGPAVEIVEDVLYEGTYSFYVGVTDEQPFQVRRFEDPQRVVLDIAG